jgi:hypothetical protein
MPNQHKYPLLGWNCETGLADWARSWAEQRGLTLKEVLTQALSEFRDRNDPGAEGNHDGTGTTAG